MPDYKTELVKSIQHEVEKELKLKKKHAADFGSYKKAFMFIIEVLKLALQDYRITLYDTPTKQPKK